MSDNDDVDELDGMTKHKLRDRIEAHYQFARG